MNFQNLEKENKLKFIGRTYEKNNMLFMNFSGSGVKFKVRSNKLRIKMFATKYDDAKSCPYISVLIDDKRFDYPLNEEHTLIEIDLTNENHIVQILKRTESSVSFAAIEDITVDEFLTFEDESKLKLEFYGDSLTCGYGNLSTVPTEPFSTKTESFLEGYAYLTAKALNADYSAVCVSGFPIYKSRWNEGFPIDSVGDMISICDYSEDMTFETTNSWDNNKYIPDIVVVNLGSNDCSYFTEGQNWVDELVKVHGDFNKVIELPVFQERLNNLEKKIVSFLDELFSKYKNVKVIWALGMVEINKHVQAVFDRAIYNYNNKNVYQLTFHSYEKSKDIGANWHPGATMHRDAAEELVAFIKENILGGVN